MFDKRLPAETVNLPRLWAGSRITIMTSQYRKSSETLSLNFWLSGALNFDLTVWACVQADHIMHKLQ